MYFKFHKKKQKKHENINFWLFCFL